MQVKSDKQLMEKIKLNGVRQWPQWTAKSIYKLYFNKYIPFFIKNVNLDRLNFLIFRKNNQIMT